MVKFGAMALITEAQLNMANLNEEPVWEEGIYQLETTDPVEGGPEGIDNKPTRQLANRTAYLKQEQDNIKEEVLLLNQQWSENANYSIGHEVVRNGLRYIARAASGPFNDGAVTPESNNGTVWDLVLPHAFSIKGEEIALKWVKIAHVFGMNASQGDSVSLEVVGGSDLSTRKRYVSEINASVRNDQIAAQATIKFSSGPDPKFYTQFINSNEYALWIEINSSQPAPLTVIQKSRSRYPQTKVGILNISANAPSPRGLVPFDYDYRYDCIPIGVEVALDTPPPTNDSRFRFVKLTADDPYNGNVLNNKVVSGTAPNLIVKMTVNDPLSPINGQQIFMLNTMQAYRRPSEGPDVVVQDASRKITATVESGYNLRQVFTNESGAFKSENSQVIATNIGQASVNGNARLVFDSSLVVPTAARNEVFAITEVRYKRIR